MKKMQPKSSPAPSLPNHRSTEDGMSVHREVQQILAKYVRSSDHRDGQAMSELFAPEGAVEVFYNDGGTPTHLFTLPNKEAIENAVSNLMGQQPARGWSHHTTHDLIIEVKGDTAYIDAQFIRFDSLGHKRPENGWPPSAAGAMGTVTPTEAGYYRPTLKMIAGQWKITTLQIIHDLPFALPG